MYRWLRNIHLWLGLFSFLFLLMYGVSSVQMAHNSWFSPRPKVSESRVAVPPASAESPRALARELMDRHGMRGELNQVRQTPDGFALRIVRPGTVYEVDYSRSTGEAKVRTNVASFIGMLNRIHHIGGIWHEYSLVNVWGVLVGLVSAALIVLGATGIYLWFKIHSERVVGIILLALSLGFSLPLIVLMRAA
jgi:hypothetical protein